MQGFVFPPVKKHIKAVEEKRTLQMSECDKGVCVCYFHHRIMDQPRKNIKNGLTWVQFNSGLWHCSKQSESEIICFSGK